MKSLWKQIVQAVVVVGVAAGLATGLYAQDAEQPGIVRISQPRTNEIAHNQVAPVSAVQMAGGCMSQSGMGSCQPGAGSFGSCDSSNTRMNCDRGGLGGGHFRNGTGCRSNGCQSIRCHDPQQQAMIDYFRCKFGYFIPTGGGGKGIPWTGHYSRVYPVNPYHTDARDGQAWAAQGYGIPMAVPLAPVVGHTYNYGHGIPSSRLTPVSRPAY